MWCKTLAMAVCLGAAALAQADSFTWRNVEISGGGWVSGIEFHPKVKDVLFARTDVGGAFKWLPNGRWAPLNDDIPREFGQELGVLSVALDPTDANRVYLLVGMYTQSWAQPGALLVSKDQGASWTRVALPFKVGGNEDGRGTGERLVVDPNKPSRLWLGSNQDGLWRSEDYGASWQKVPSFPAKGITLVEIDATTTSKQGGSSGLFVATTETTNALLHSTDGGTTWAPVANQPKGVFYHRAAWDKRNVLFTTNNGIGPNGISEGALWRLDTQKAQWTNISPPKGQGGFAGLALDPQNPARILVGTTNRWWPRDEIFLSEDAGRSWKSVLSDENWNLNGAPFIREHKPNWLVDLAFDPFNSARAFVVTGYGVLEARNVNSQQPVKWEFAAKGLEETVILELISPPRGHLCTV